MATNDLSSLLSPIRERWAARKRRSIGFDPVDAVVLLAAVEAALKAADEWDAEARGIFLEAARTADAGEVGAASALQSAAADLRTVIAAALAGKQAGDGR